MTFIPPLSFAFRAEVTIGAAVDHGLVDGQRRRFIPITGGRVEGPRLSGEVLPGGGDWQILGADGTIALTARYALKAHDGGVIRVRNAGFRHGLPDVLARIETGEPIDPSAYYFRTAPRFEADAAGPHGWLTRTIFIATAERSRNAVVLDFFAVE